MFGTVCLCVCVCAFSLHRESPDMILGDKPLISEAVLSHQWPTSRYFYQVSWWKKISWTSKWTKHHWLLEYGLVCCTSDLMLVIHDWYALYDSKNLFMLKIYAYFMFLVISSHICVLIFKTYPFMTYICTAICPTPKSFDYWLFEQFPNISEQPGQFKPDMSDFLAQTCPALGSDMSGYRASGYIKGGVPLQTLVPQNLLHSSLVADKALPRRFCISSPNPFGF
jgi:hypothetical protein